MPPFDTTPPSPVAPSLWRGLADRTAPTQGLADEFPEGATEWPTDLSRREFVQIMGASLALAGLTACGRTPTGKLVPRVASPESMPVADARYYATAMPIEGYARGIVVTTHFGRPTKIEGNPDHPESLGATDAITQAAILSLYDPDRSRVPLRAGQPSRWTDFEGEWLSRRADLAARHGAGLALLTEPTTSPTLLREIHRVLKTFTEAKWYQHTALPRYDAAGHQIDFDFAAAEVALSIASDCFYRHPAAVRYARAFAQRRRAINGRVNLCRFFAIEPTPSVTGSMADSRLPASPARTHVLLNAIAAELDGQPHTEIPLSPEEKNFVRDFTVAVRASPKTSVCTAGPECDPDIRAWADVFNRRFGGAAARDLPAIRSDGDAVSVGTLADLTTALERGEVQALFILGANPAYTAPVDLLFAKKLVHVPFSVHLGGYVDETASLCQWRLPESYFLETWSDLRAFDGAATILQPLIEPLHATRSTAEMLRLISDPSGAEAYDIVRETWHASSGDADFETHWHRWLDRGVVDGSASAPISNLQPTPANFPQLAAAKESVQLTAIFTPDPNVGDGCWANNAWLQELPKPLTKLVWDNAALISPALAVQLNLENGDVVECAAAGDLRLEAPVWIMPGQADACVTLSLGYGRTRAGTIGSGRGYNAYHFRTTDALWHREVLNLRKLGRRYALVSTQHHFEMEGREPVRVVAPNEAGRAIEESKPATSLYPEWKRGRYAWGMSIDLSTCIGCNACVVACQAENNIPVTGKDQVARGREMHWIRVDRYFEGEPSNPRLLHQPVPCMQCENAPCELVCPVAATVHSTEGLNDMIYNRCIGTRYCSNNCPYKVRRFNFFDYREPADSPVYLQKNPDVTVRERGVMEKCTYCVQRINAARIAAEKEGRRIRDGEIQTACQQACPAEAIVFGDLNDAMSRVAQRKSEPTSYRLLAELNTRPRTTYLAKVRAAETPAASS